MGCPLGHNRSHRDVQISMLGHMDQREDYCVIKQALVFKRKSMSHPLVQTSPYFPLTPFFSLLSLSPSPPISCCVGEQQAHLHTVLQERGQAFLVRQGIKPFNVLFYGEPASRSGSSPTCKKGRWENGKGEESKSSCSYNVS